MTILAILAALSLAPEKRDSLLADTQGNEAVWSRALSIQDPERLRCVEYLFTTIPRLDRLEMTWEALMDHVLGALDSRDNLCPDLPDSIFMPFLLDYRMSEEPVTAYRTPLSVYWTRELGTTGGLPETAEALREAVSEMSVNPREFLGGVAEPLDVLEARAGTPTELRVLFGSSLRALGIPVRPVLAWFQGEHGREAGWLEAWFEGSWHPMPLASDSIPSDFAGLSMAYVGNRNTVEDYVPCGTVVFSPLDSAAGDYGVWLSVEAPGRLIPLDWLEIEPADSCRVELGAGRYLLQITKRLENGTVRLWTRWLYLDPGSEATVDVAEIVGTGPRGFEEFRSRARATGSI